MLSQKYWRVVVVYKRVAVEGGDGCLDSDHTRTATHTDNVSTVVSSNSTGHRSLGPTVRILPKESTGWGGVTVKPVLCSSVSSLSTITHTANMSAATIAVTIMGKTRVLHSVFMDALVLCFRGFAEGFSLISALIMTPCEKGRWLLLSACLPADLGFHWDSRLHLLWLRLTTPLITGSNENWLIQQGCQEHCYQTDSHQDQYVVCGTSDRYTHTHTV